MRLTPKEAAAVLGEGYNADIIKRGIKQGKFPFGVAIEGEPTDYYPRGKTTYIIDSERLTAWMLGSDLI